MPRARQGNRAASLLPPDPDCARVLDLAITGFTLAFLALGFRRPFLWVLAYLYIDILSPQQISYRLLTALPISLIAFVLAFAGWALLDDKRDSRFTLRQGLIGALLLYCGASTTMAEPGTPWAPLDVTIAIARIVSRSVSDTGVLVAWAMNTAASVM